MIQKNSTMKVLEIFFREPTNIHFIREMGRKIKLAPTSVKNNIKKLLKEELILEKKSKPFNGYIANRDNENFLFYKKMANIASIKDSGLLDFIVNSIYPKTIILYGSYLRGEDLESSDVDLLIISKAKKEINLKKFEHILKRKIHLMIKQDLKKLQKNLRTEIINGFVLYGCLKNE